MNRRRVFWLGALALLVYAAGRPASVAADSQPGYATPGTCVTGWTAYSMPYTASVSGVEIRFHLWVNAGAGQTTVQGRWETGEWNGTGVRWSAAPPSAQWFVNRSTFPDTFVVLGAGYSPGGWLRYGLTVVDGPGCFTIDSVSVVRYSGSGEGVPPTPTPTPAGSPTATPGGSAGPSASPTMGFCSVYDGSTWQWVPCNASTPSPSPEPTPSPSPSGPVDLGAACPVPASGPGTFTMSFKSSLESCVVWEDHASGTATATLNGTTGSWWFAGTVATINCQAGGQCHANVYGHVAGGATDPDNWPTIDGSQIGWYDQSSNGQVAAAWKARNYSNQSITVNANAGNMVIFETGSDRYNGNDGSGNGWDGTFTVGVTGSWDHTGVPTPTPTAAPTATASPTPTPDTFCTENPGSWLCASAPPGWATPPPSSPPGQEPWMPVEICQPGTIASDRLACSTWPPPGPQSSIAPASITPVGLSIFQDGWADLSEQLGTKVPFGWGAQVIGALDASDYEGAGLTEFCMLSVPTGVPEESIDVCVDPYTISNAFAPYRTALAGLIAVYVSWHVAAWVWSLMHPHPQQLTLGL